MLGQETFVLIVNNTMGPRVAGEAASLNVRTKFMPLSHPILISELYAERPASRYVFRLNYTALGLAKLLMYGAFARAQADAENITLREVVLKEARNYPYTLKKKPEVL